MRQNTFSKYKQSNEKYVSHLYLHSRRNINFISIHCFTLSYHLLESLQCHHFLCMSTLWVMPWLRQLATSFSSHRPRFRSRPVRVESVVGRVAVVQHHLVWILQFPPVSITPPMPHTHSPIANTTLSSELTASLNNALNTFTAIVDLSRFNNSCLKSTASTLVDLTFQSRALRSFSLNQLRNLSL